MKEDFLHFLWRTKRLDFSHLQTTEGHRLEILDFGQHNSNAGPDFLQAKIKIDKTIWAGNIEVHLKSSDWMRHGHQDDRAYDNVILHLVLEEDELLFRKDKSRIACLELKKRIPEKTLAVYQKLIHNEYWIPCQHKFHEVSEITKSLWLDRMLVERLERKTKEIELILKQNKNNWEETFYRFSAKNFGLKVNTFPFEMLAQSVSLLTLSKHKNKLLQLEALLFGQAGMLHKDFSDDYPQLLKREYKLLQKKYRLSPIPEQAWRFLRMRPSGFPTIRIAQFAALINQSKNLFSKILELESPEHADRLFDIEVSSYWTNHFLFDKESQKHSAKIGKSTVRLFIINTIVPVLFLYGAKKGNDDFKNRAFRLLEQVKPEQNSILTKWKELGFEPNSAYQTQALLELKNEYCNHRKCLNCAIGNKILH